MRLKKVAGAGVEGEGPQPREFGESAVGQRASWLSLLVSVGKQAHTHTQRNEGAEGSRSQHQGLYFLGQYMLLGARELGVLGIEWSRRSQHREGRKQGQESTERPRTKWKEKWTAGI